MKRVMCGLLVMLLSVCFVETAMAQNEGFTIAQYHKLLGDVSFQPKLSRIRLVGQNTFYSLEDDGGIYSWQIGQSDVSLLCHVTVFDSTAPYALLSPAQQLQAHEAVTHIFSGKSHLWAYNILFGRFGKVTAQGVAWKDTFNVKDESWDPRRYGDIVGGFADDTFLHIAYNDTYHRIDLETGISDSYILPIGTYGFQPYKDNNALTWNLTSSMFEIYEINLNNGEYNRLPIALPKDEYILGLEYLTASNSLYLMTLSEDGKSRLYLSSGGNELANMGIVRELGRIIFLEDETYALVDEKGITIKNIKSISQPGKTILRIKGFFSYEGAAIRFMQDNPDVVVELQNSDVIDEQDFVSIITGSSDIDIYSMFTSQLFRAVKEKGYAASLNCSDVLKNSAESMYRVYKETITNVEGDIIAWPDPFIVFKTLAIDVDLWKACFGEKPYPVTFPDMLNAMTEWERDFSSQNENTIVYFPGSIQNLLFNMVFKYIGNYETKDTWIDFNTTYFRESLSAFENLIAVLDIERMEQIVEKSDENNRFKSLFWAEGLYGENTSFFNPEDDMQRTAWPVFEQGSDPIMEVTFVALWINQNSSNKEIAIRFLESLTNKENVSPNIKYILYEGLTEEVENPDYKKNVQELTERKHELRSALQEVDEANARFFEDAIKALDADLARLEDSQYIVTKAGIERYAKWVKQLKSTSDSYYLTQNDTNDEFSKKLIELCALIVSGAMSGDEFIEQLNGISRLIYLERR